MYFMPAALASGDPSFGVEFFGIEKFGQALVVLKLQLAIVENQLAVAEYAETPQ